MALSAAPTPTPLTGSLSAFAFNHKNQNTRKCVERRKRKVKKLYAIKLKGGYYHRYNLGQIVCFENKDNARAYMKYNHYEGSIEQLDIDLDKQKRIIDIEAKLAESEKALEAKESINQMYKSTLSLKDSDFSDLVRENAQLKNELKQYKIKYTVGLAQFISDNSIKIAITELEKLKTELVNNVSPVRLSYTEYVQEVFNKIDSHIEILKEKSRS